MWGKTKGYILENRWTFLTIVIASVMVIMIGRNVIHAIKISYQISILNAEKALYQASITEDSTLIENLKYDYELERYAREKYLMQREGEEIFIIKEKR